MEIQTLRVDGFHPAWWLPARPPRSAAPHLSGLRIPTLFLSSLNDPFVPPEIFTPHHGTLPGTLRFLHPSRGGHVGYWQDEAPHFWAGKALLDFMEHATGRQGRTE